MEVVNYESTCDKTTAHTEKGQAEYQKIKAQYNKQVPSYEMVDGHFVPFIVEPLLFTKY